MAPVVPQVVHHAPHVGILQALLGILILRLARRQRQHDGSAALVDGLAYHVYLVGIERARHVVHLDEVDAPLGIEVYDAVVVQLAVLIVAHQQVVLQPRAGRRRAVVHLAPGRRLAALQLVRRAHHRLRHAAHDVDAELQSLLVQLVSQRLEAHVLAVHHTRRESCGRRQVASVLVEHIVLVAALVVVAASQRRVVAVPANVHHHILPSVLHQVVVHKVLCILHHLLLRDRRVVAVPRVPPHGWRQRPGPER